jgi:hypothetical protein
MNSGGIIITHTVVAAKESPDTSAVCSVTRGIMRERAVQLAISHGRLAHEANKDDWEHAKQELSPDDGLQNIQQS